MTHDPLCPVRRNDFALTTTRPTPMGAVGVTRSLCHCDLIAKVRADQEVETLSDVADAAILFLGYTGDEVRKLTVGALDALRNSR